VQAARCSYPTEFYRASLGVCEDKAGNPLYRSRSAGKTLSKVKSVRPVDRPRLRPGAVSRSASRARGAPVAAPDIDAIDGKTMPLAAPEPRDASGEYIAEFEARWSPVWGMGQPTLSATDGMGTREGQIPNASEH